MVLVAAVAAGCGGGGDGRPVFERARATFSRVDRLHVRLFVNAHQPVERTATMPASALPLQRLHLSRWVQHPRRYDCEAGLECARGDLDVKGAARELEPLLPNLPFDAGSVDSAKVEVAIGKRDGILRRARLSGDVFGLQFEVEVTATPRA